MRALLALFLLVPLAACGTDDAPVPSSVPSPVVVRDSASVELRVGQQLVVVLDANATTGFEWRVTTEPTVGVLSVSAGPTYEPTPTTAPLVGVGGTTTTRFTGAGIGMTRVVMSYRRSFEPDEPDLRTVTVEVAVRS